VEEFVDDRKDNRVGCRYDHLGTTWRQRQQDAWGQNEKQQRSR
jgi:hypothetical protein